MATNCHSLRIADASLHQRVDGGLRACHKLFAEIVVGQGVAFPYNGHFRIVEDGPSQGEEGERPPVADSIEFVRRIGHLSRHIGIYKLLGIGPHHHRDAPSVVAWRKIECA